MLKKTVKELGFHSLIYMLGVSMRILASLILLPVYTRFLSTADYGVLEIIDNMRAQLMHIVIAGFLPAMAKFYQDTDSEYGRKESVGTSFWFVFVSGLFWSAVLFLFHAQLAGFLLGNVNFIFYIDLGISLLFIQVIYEVGNSYLNILKKSQLFVIIGLIKLCVGIGTNLYFIVGLRFGAEGMLLGDLLSSALMSAFLAGYLILKNGLHFDFHVFGRMLKFGLPFIPNLFAASLMHGADRSLLRPRWPSMSDIGIYGLGYKLPWMLNFLVLQSFGRIWNMSVMYEVAKQEDYQNIHTKVTTYFMTAYVVCQYILAIMAPTTIRVLAAPEYFSAWRVAQVVCLGMSVYAIHSFFITGAYIKNKTWYLPIAHLVATLFNVAFNWYFLPQFSYLAAAWITVLTYSIFSLLNFLIFRKIYPIPFEFGRLAFLFSAAIILVLVNNVLYVQNGVLEFTKEVFFSILLPLIILFGPYLDRTEKESLGEELQKIHPKLAHIYAKITDMFRKNMNHGT